MRIVIDAYQMRPAVTGTDRQARNILRELQKLDTKNEYIVIVNRDIPFVSEVVTAQNFKLRPTHFHKRASWIFLGLPLDLLMLRADVFYSFHNLTAPGLPVCPSVVSAMDLIPFLYQKRYYKGWKSYWFRRLIVLGYMRNAVRTARSFWAISEFTKNEMVKYFKADRKKFHVAYLQAEDSFSVKPDASRVKAVKEKFGIKDGFVYAIGGAEPRKNNLMLIEAHRRLPQELRERYPLVIAGAVWQGEDLTNKEDKYLILAGYVSEEDHVVLFASATVFAWPTHYEGFGLPVLEAMAAGTPVISSNTTSMPEVAGDAALMFDPNSRHELEEALLKVLSDEKLRERLHRAGLERSKQFSWKKTAEMIHKLITEG